MTTLPNATHEMSYAEGLDDAAAKPRAEMQFSTLGHNEAIDDLLELREKCQQDDWDGYGAPAVHQDTLHMAFQFLRALPLGFPRPTVGAEPDGHVTLEWYKSPLRLLSVSVDPDRKLHYAGLFGDNKRYGVLIFFGTAPAELIQLVQEL